MSRYYDNTEYMLDRIYRDKTDGKLMEETFKQAINIAYLKKYPKARLQDTTNTPLDFDQGTDFVLHHIEVKFPFKKPDDRDDKATAMALSENFRLRLDPTTNFKGKNNMPFICDTGIMATENTPFMIGIRHGRKEYETGHHVDFEQPVIVIGIDPGQSFYRQNRFEIETNMKKNIDKIVDKAIEAYVDYSLKNDKVRAMLTEKTTFSSPLKVNPHYSESKGAIRHINERYKTLNDLVRMRITSRQKQRTGFDNINMEPEEKSKEEPSFKN